MNDLLSALRINQFEPLLRAYLQQGAEMRNALDGGAGWGRTSSSIAEHLPDGGTVFAFEPFPGNHRFFDGLDARIRLIPQALAETGKRGNFTVRTVVAESSSWGRSGMAGYSSVGTLSAVRDDAHSNFDVECVAADDIIPLDTPIDFVKLDLQGGELNALKGMPRILRDAKLLWVEFSHSGNGLLEFIIDSGYMVFDTEYLFIGEPTASALDLFDVTVQDYVLSTGAKAWFGFRRKPWENFKAEFHRCRRDLGMIQTDLVCVNKTKLPEFLAALSHLAAQRLKV